MRSIGLLLSAWALLTVPVFFSVLSASTEVERLLAKAPTLTADQLTGKHVVHRGDKTPTAVNNTPLAFQQARVKAYLKTLPSNGEITEVVKAKDRYQSLRAAYGGKLPVGFNRKVTVYQGLETRRQQFNLHDRVLHRQSSEILAAARDRRLQLRVMRQQSQIALGQ